MQRVSYRRHRKPFTTEEDSLLIALVRKHGKDWNLIAKEMLDRNPRQCRDRYTDYLRPDLTNTPWTTAEDRQLLDLVKQKGNKCASIARALKNRSESMVKGRLYQLLKNRKEPEPEPEPEATQSEVVDFTAYDTEPFENAMLEDLCGELLP